MSKILETPENFKTSIFEKYIFGVKGKKAIYYQLTNLSKEYNIYNDIKLIDVVIDFVVIGSTGIYCITAKSHEVTLGYNGEELTKWKQPFEENFISKAKSDVLVLNKYLLTKLNKKYDIIPVIVFSSRFAKMTFGLSPIEHVFVIPIKLLLKLINERPIILNNGEIEEIKEILDLTQKTTK